MKKKSKALAVPKFDNDGEAFAKGLIKESVQNSFSGIFDFPSSMGVGFGTQLNQLDTLFINNRWQLLSNMRQILSQIYVEHGLIQTIIDVPVDDALRGGVDITSEQLGEDDIHKLQTHMEREDDLNVFGRAMKWNRLFGGAGVLPIMYQDPFMPLDVASIPIGMPIEFRAVDMWELFYNKQNTGEFDVELQEYEFDYFNYYGKQLHRSRVFIMKGREAPSFIRPRLRGWGFSEIEPLINALNQWLKSNNLVFEVLDEFKLDVYQFQGLKNSIATKDGTDRVKARVQLMNATKNFQNAVVMDKDDIFDHKQLSFSGIAEMYAEFRMQIACAMRMPISKIFGVASSGFSSGEDDIENYNAMIESQIRAKCKYDLMKMIEIRCQQLFGYVPDDLEIDFKPLRVLSAEQEENTKTQKFNRLILALDKGAIQYKQFAEAVNKDNILGVKLDPEDELSPPAAEGDGEGGDEEDKVTEKPKDKGASTKLKAKEAKT